jgi:hypothetical protein
LGIQLQKNAASSVQHFIFINSYRSRVASRCRTPICFHCLLSLDVASPVLRLHLFNLLFRHCIIRIVAFLDD